MNNFLIKAIEFISTRLGLMDTISHNYNSNSIKSYSDTDLKSFLRDLKIRIFYDDDIKPDINRLTEKEQKILRQLSEDGMIIIGSYVLKLYGLLDRKINDFDVIYKLDDAKEEGIIKNNNIINGNIDDYDQQDDNVEHRIKVKYKGKKIDIFQTKNEQEIIITDGIVHSHYYDILKSKLSYKRIKDYEDFIQIKKKLGMAEEDYANGGIIRKLGNGY